MIKAAIFDHDGVVADTARLHFKAYNLALAKYGIQLKEKDFELIQGRRSKEIAMIAEKSSGKKLDDKSRLKAKEDKDRTYRKIARDHLKLVKGASDFLTMLRKNNIRCALASSSVKKNIDMSFRKLKLKRYFDAVVTGEEVINGKPHPDIFLKAAKRLNIAPKDCVVFEDAVSGIIAAKRARMRSVALLTTTGRKKLASAGADMIIKDFRQINYEKLMRI